MLQELFLSFSMRAFFRPPIIVLGFILATYLAFGLYHLSEFITADEHYWVYERIPQYWDSIAHERWKKTLINDKPGVTLALISGVALFYDHDPERLCSENENKLITCNAAHAQSLLLAFRLPLLFFNLLMLVYLFFVLRKLISQWEALYATGFMAFSPILLGITQIINPDTVLWSTSAGALFSYLALLKLRKVQYLFLTGLFLALAILSKYTASFLLPFFIFISVLFPWVDTALSTREAFASILRKNILFFIGTFLVAILFGFLFLPAAWVSSSILFQLFWGGGAVAFPLTLLLLPGIFVVDVLFCGSRFTYSVREKFIRVRSLELSAKILSWFVFFSFIGLLLGRFFFPDWILFDKVPFDLKDLYSNDKADRLFLPNFPQAYLLELNPLAFSLPPILLLPFLALCFFLGTKKEKNITQQEATTLSLFFFIVAFLVTFIFSEILATARYLIMLYPIMAYLAALGIEPLFQTMGKYPPLFWQKRPSWLVPSIVGTCSLLSLFQSAPYFFNYTNNVLPKENIIHHAWGYGGYEAAQYLNSLPNAKGLTIWADYIGVCEFFVGKCLTTDYDHAAKTAFDYVVLSTRGEEVYKPEHIRWLKPGNFYAAPWYADPSPLWQLAIDNRPENFVKIVPVNPIFRAALITDIDHCPTREAVSEEHLQSFLSFSQEKDMDFIVSLGDNGSHRLRNCSETADLDVRYIANRLRSILRPVSLVLGDHDIASSTDSYKAWLKTTDKDTTYYSFNDKGVHVIVLDTVLGGDAMRPPCEDDPLCSTLLTREQDLKKLSFTDYQAKYPETLGSQKQERVAVETILKQEQQTIDLTRSAGARDRGRVGAEELEWLKQDLADTDRKKVVVFSDHPLIPFLSPKKSYNIVNGDKVREILEKSGKEVVAISGEAHLWHEEEQNGIHYYIVDEFRKNNGSWASFTWDDAGFRMEEISHTSENQ